MRKVTILFAALALAIPSFALAQDDEEGWFIGIEGGSLKAGGAETILGVPLDAGGNPTGELVTLDYDSGTSYGALLGFSNGESRFAVSYWQYDEDADLSVMSADGFFLALPIADSGTDTGTAIDAMGNLETHTIDLTWSRPIAQGDRSSFHWTIGIRQWELEQMTEVTYDATRNILLGTNAEGIGLVAGVGASYDFSDRLSGSTCLKLGFLTGDMDAAFADDNASLPTDVMLDGADRNFRHTELDTRLNFGLLDSLDLFVGYQYKQFDEARTQLYFPDDIQEGFLFDTTNDVSYSGLTAGALFTF